MNILDTEPEERFDVITKEAINFFHVPISTISILDKDREWFKSCQGLNAREGDRSISFCGHALLAEKIFIVEDTLKDLRFADNPHVTGEPHIRFYAGIALHDPKTLLPVGVFCIKDYEPRKLTPQEISMFIDLGQRAEDELSKKSTN